MSQSESPEQQARRRFPRGLEQPAGSLRFGADALLLAAYAARHVETLPVPAATEARGGHTHVAVELGCGCGAALLGLALRCPHILGLGLDREETLVQAAVRNAQRLSLADRLQFLHLDLADRAALRTVPHPDSRRLDLALANPPYDIAGRPSPRGLREHGLRGMGSACADASATEGGMPRHKTALHCFCAAAATLLRRQGYFFCIYDARALPRLCDALHEAGLGLRRLLPVHARPGQPALRVLATARKDAAHDVVMETPLVLHDRDGWTGQALGFCSWLKSR